MSITLELKPEIEARAAREAATRGVPVETFLAEVIEENLNGGKKKKSFYETATIEEWSRELRAWAASHDRKTPALSDEAMSRESIYEDRW